MSYVRPASAGTAALLWLLGALHGTSYAQDPAPTTHKHYEASDEANQPGPEGQLAPRLQNLGSHTFKVSTRHRDAQRFFNQGLNLSYGFNHAEARRAFREAARLDPGLAMAHWGEALVLGPNINAPMEPDVEPEAHQAAEKAASLAGRASARERALISALQVRYTGRAGERRANDEAYAASMRDVHRRFPNDPDIATLYVESMMNLRPWGYWMPDGRPHEGTEEIVALTERVMARHPKHPGALHLYIHLIEPTATPERAERAADALLPLMPAAGHMVHMPSHIYQRVGRYADAMKSNELAILADEDYITQCRAQGLYPVGYYPHNIHFLWFAASADGQSAAAIDAARKVASRVDDETLTALPMLAAFRVVPYWALTRFGRWDEMLAEPEPPATSAFLRGGWHYARGLAHLGKHDVTAAEAELARLRAILTDPSLDGPLFSPNTARNVLGVGPEVLAGEIAAARGRFDEAITNLERAVRLEDALVYTEPAEWHFPPRLVLGAVLLEAGRPAEAETVYWEDLRRNRNNGWALTGLVSALRAQGRDDEVALIEARREEAWRRADVELTSSRFGRVSTGRPAAP